MKFIDILYPKSYYKNRNDKIKDIIIKNIQIDVKNDDCIITSNINDYKTTISFKGDKIDTLMDIKINCTCKSFAFEFSKVIRDNNGLLIENTYPNTKSNKNKFNILSSCKHTIKLAQFIYQRRTLFEQDIVKQKENISG